MKKIIVAAVMFFALAGVVLADDLPLDISSSWYQTLSTDTFRIRNITLPGYEGVYWADLQWNPATFVFVPVNVGFESTTPPTQSITGTYSLKAFTVKYSNGVIMTEKDASASGTMKIGASTISQSMTLNGVSAGMSGSYSITYGNGTTAGALNVTNYSGTHSHLSFSISGNDLTTYSGVVSLNSTITFEEWDIWEKNSDSVQSTSLHAMQAQSTEPAFKSIGEIIFEKNLIDIP